MKTWVVSLKFLLIMTVLTGVAYPLFITLVAQIGFRDQADGSIVKSKNGEAKGSRLIAQAFKESRYFWPRPSGIDYNPMSSGATNLGPTSQDLLTKVKERSTAGAVDDLLFASGSGLDPHISPNAALSQVPRVAKNRGMSNEKLSGIVEAFIEKRQLGFLGDERVNVLQLNLALDAGQ